MSASAFFPGSLYMHDLAVIGSVSTRMQWDKRGSPPGSDGTFERVWWPKCVEVTAVRLHKQLYPVQFDRGGHNPAVFLFLRLVCLHRHAIGQAILAIRWTNKVSSFQEELENQSVLA